MDPVSLIFTIGQFYIWLIIIYVLMSWFPISGVFEDIRNVLATIVEPYLGIFRKVIPPLGMMDISPIVAIIVLQLLMRLLAQALIR
jgi:YggT family protein